MDPAPVRIVVSGSESTGKSTLARRLAARLDAPWVPEWSRVYAETKGAPLDAADVEPIARGTIAAADAAAAAAGPGGPLVHDTDLASTLVYAHHYYGVAPRWIEDAWRARLPALYLLCHPDVPWVPDGVRDRPLGRTWLHAQFAARLAASGVPVVDVRGADWAARDAIADAAVDALLAREARARVHPPGAAP